MIPQSDAAPPINTYWRSKLKNKRESERDLTQICHLKSASFKKNKRNNHSEWLGLAGQQEN